MSSSKQNEWADKALDNMTDTAAGATSSPLGVSLVDSDGDVSGWGARVQSPTMEAILQRIADQNEEVLMHLRNITGINED